MDQSWQFSLPLCASHKRAGDSAPSAEEEFTSLESCDVTTDFELLSSTDAPPYPYNSYQRPLSGAKDLEALIKLERSARDGMWCIRKVDCDFSFDQGFLVTVKAIQSLRAARASENRPCLSQRRSPLLIGVSGSSGSGKSELSNKLSSVLGGEDKGVYQVSMKSYIDPSRIDSKTDSTDLDVIDMDLLLSNLIDMRGTDHGSVQHITTPVGSPGERKTRRIAIPSIEIILLEGVHAYHPDIVALCDLNVFVSGGVLASLSTRVKNTAARYADGFPSPLPTPILGSLTENTGASAEISIMNTYDPLSSFSKPTYALKTQQRLEDDIIYRLFAQKPKVRTLEYTDEYLKPPGQSDRNNNSNKASWRGGENSASHTEDYKFLRDWIRVRSCDSETQISYREWLTEGKFIISPATSFVEVPTRVVEALKNVGYVFGMRLEISAQIYSGRAAGSLHTITITREIVKGTDLVFVNIHGLSKEVVRCAANTMGLRSDSLLTMSTVAVCLARQKKTSNNDNDDSNNKSCKPSVTKSKTASQEGLACSNNSSTTDESHSAARKTKTKGKSKTWESTAAEVAMGYDNLSRSQSEPGADHAGENESKELWELQKTLSTSPPPAAKAVAIQQRHSLELKAINRNVNLDEGYILILRAIQILRGVRDGKPVILGVAGPPGSGKTLLSRKVLTAAGSSSARIGLDSYIDEGRFQPGDPDAWESLDVDLLLEHITKLRSGASVSVPVFDLEKGRRTGFRHVCATDHNGLVVLEGVHALNPALRKMLDLRIAVVGGVHYHLVKRCLDDVSRARGPSAVTLDSVTDMIFPNFRSQLEPELACAHLRIENLFDPLCGLLEPMYVLRAPMAATTVAVKGAGLGSVEDAIWKSLGAKKEQKDTTVYNTHYQDIYLQPPGHAHNSILGSGGSSLNSTSASSPGEQFVPPSNTAWVRVRQHKGRYMLLFRDSIREGDMIVQPRVDFEVPLSTVMGLLGLGYQIKVVIEVHSKMWHTPSITVSVDECSYGSTTVVRPSCFIQVKGTSRDSVVSMGHMLKLDGNCTTKPSLQLLLDAQGKQGQGVSPSGSVIALQEKLLHDSGLSHRGCEQPAASLALELTRANRSAIMDLERQLKYNACLTKCAIAIAVTVTAISVVMLNRRDRGLTAAA